MRVVSLGSGSSGNALFVQAGRASVLIDAGFNRRTLVSRLRQAGAQPAHLSAILLTHEHYDHACGAAALASQFGIPLISDPRTLRAVLAHPSVADLPGQPIERLELPVGHETRLNDVQIRSFPVSHDAVAPCGYVVSTGAWSVCVAIDTGEVAEPALDAMRQAHLLVVEANHDVERLRTGPYPWHLKRRILNPTGHLSNDQAAQALGQVLDDGPRWVWLAHLSRTNNTPDLARTAVRDQLRSWGLGHVALSVAPPGMGPVWDSAALWETVSQPVLLHDRAGSAG